MRILKVVGIAMAILVILFFGIAVFLPSEVHVKRSLVVPASPKVVFAQVNDLRQWPKWSPWHQMDPTMSLTYEGSLTGEGASYHWESQEAGNGSLTITESHPHRYIAIDLDFREQGTATGYYQFEATDKGTKVTWGFETDMGTNPVAKYMGLFIDSMVGSDFERGLNNLREHVKNLSSSTL